MDEHDYLDCPLHAATAPKVGCVGGVGMAAAHSPDYVGVLFYCPEHGVCCAECGKALPVSWTVNAPALTRLTSEQIDAIWVPHGYADGCDAFAHPR